MGMPRPRRLRFSVDAFHAGEPEPRAIHPAWQFARSCIVDRSSMRFQSRLPLPRIVQGRVAQARDCGTLHQCNRSSTSWRGGAVVRLREVDRGGPASPQDKCNLAHRPGYRRSLSETIVPQPCHRPYVDTALPLRSKRSARILMGPTRCTCERQVRLRRIGTVRINLCRGTTTPQHASGTPGGSPSAIRFETPAVFRRPELLPIASLNLLARRAPFRRSYSAAAPAFFSSFIFELCPGKMLAVGSR